MTYTEFMQLFPTNDACLDYLRDKFYPAGSGCPDCGKASEFHRISGRSAYSCQLSPPGLPDRRDDLPQVHDQLAALVLVDLPHVIDSLRDQRQAA
jgi:hypothetical protein